MSVSLFRFLWLAQRKARGGNKKQSFVDGWIEFADKRVAKSVAKMLNCRPMGGKSTSFYSADIWNLKCDCDNVFVLALCVACALTPREPPPQTMIMSLK